MNSTIFIDDTDEEVIDLDSSQDAIIDVCDKGSSERPVNPKEIFLANDTEKADEVIAENDRDEKKVSVPTVSEHDDGPKPLFKVMFRDESVSRQYRKRIKDFLENLISTKYREEKEDSDSCNLTLEIWDSDADSLSQPIDSTTESEDSQDIVCDTLFTVDTQPKLHDDLDVPTYGKKYSDVFEKSNVEKAPETKDDYLPKLTCFNCMGNHKLQDCTEPRIQANINKNRKNFNMKGNSRAVRYHLDDDQKFGHMVPGQLSSTLRKALGLRENELPRHIYRMRILGYPPGWLEEARLQHSGLSLFNSDGLPDADPNDERGMIFDIGDKDQYDTKKIFDFPGFNVPPPPGTHDDCREYWASDVQTHHSKQRMLLMLKGKKADDGYKRKKLKVSNTVSNNSSEAVPSEMEIEEVDVESVVECVPVNGLFIPPLPRETLVKPPEPPRVAAQQPVSEDSDCQSQEVQSPESPGNSTSPSSRANSPSLSELETMKKQLLVELQDSGSQSNPDTPVKSSSLNSTLKSDMPPPSTDATPEMNRSRGSRCALNSSQGSVKSVDLGTPVLQSTSPYSKLPSSEKFSKNICDVINFENLPDSTGKYEQMTGVLQKVRNTLAKLNEDSP